MLIIHSDAHEQQNAKYELLRGQLVPSFEAPVRARIIRDAVRAACLGEFRAPDSHALDTVLRVHDPAMVTFLQTSWARWQAENGDIDAVPNTWPPPRSRSHATERIGAQLGAYCVDMSSAIQAGTWTAVRGAADIAMTAASAVSLGERAVFAMSRPPGHHSGRDFFGGYCFLNNAAIAAQSLRDSGLARIAILDIDYHHGNGTQDIFYDRNDVLTVSLHADPKQDYPYYSGFGDERGTGLGEGFNLNLPMPWGTASEGYGECLAGALDAIRAFDPAALVLGLGVDTFENDPISRFRLKASDFLTIGRTVESLGLPTVIIMEGGYATEALGENFVAVLRAFAERN